LEMFLKLSRDDHTKIGSCKFNTLTYGNDSYFHTINYIV
jgi:hypothetical protein